ncbi:MAG: ABC transporter permease [Propionibacteriaceae bacterium]|jgi:ABC transporter DrrB family efflux protein|nr:ABC transporter permease [Propionibacteriaceae bacterium]
MRLLATTRRVIAQLAHDHRTVALILIVPMVLVGLFAWLFSSGEAFQTIGPIILGLFPFVLMFIVTSVATLRERTSGTLERYMTTPASRTSLIFGYALAFGIFAIIQALLTVFFAVWVCGLDIDGPLWQLILIAAVNAICGTAMGLFASAFARTEFQAVQMMPVFVLPQVVVGGVFMPIDAMDEPLQWFAHCLPLTYAIEAVQAVAGNESGWAVGRPVLILAAFAVGFLVVSSLTMPRKTA